MSLWTAFLHDVGKRDRGAPRRAGMKFRQWPAAVEDQSWQ
jgi:hypothetical protein